MFEFRLDCHVPSLLRALILIVMRPYKWDLKIYRGFRMEVAVIESREWILEEIEREQRLESRE